MRCRYGNNCRRLRFSRYSFKIIEQGVDQGNQASVAEQGYAGIWIAASCVDIIQPGHGVQYPAGDIVQQSH